MTAKKLLTFALTGILLCPLLPAQERGKELQDRYQAACKAEENRDYLAALREYDRILAVQEDFEDCDFRREECQLLAEWQRKLKGPPTAADLVGLGEILCGLERTAEERASYRDAIRLDPGCTEAHGHLALLNYTTRGGNILTVVKETIAHLETSPYREHLQKAIADFKVFGNLRTLRVILGKERAEYGQHVVQNLSVRLTEHYGRGFTRANLFHMVRFAEAFPDEQIVYALCRQLSWSHFRALICHHIQSLDLGQPVFGKTSSSDSYSLKTLLAHGGPPA